MSSGINTIGLSYSIGISAPEALIASNSINRAAPIRLEEVPADKRDFIKRISQDEWDQVMAVERRRASDEEVEDLRWGRWDRPIFQEANWIYSAFDAYLENRLDQETMCTLFLYDACCKTREKEGTPLKSLQAHQLYDEHGRINKGVLHVLKEATKEYLSPEQFLQLIETFKSWPAHRTQFFAITRFDDPLLRDIAHPNELNWGLFVRRLGLCDGVERVQQMVVPPHLMYAIHKAKWGDNAMLPDPALGFSWKEKLSDTSKRVVSIPSFFLLPERVHEMRADPLSIYHHDLVYHLAIESANPHRKIWADFAKFLGKAEHGASWMVPIVLDREFINYIRNKKEIATDDFWIAVSHCFDFLKKENPEYQPEEFGKAFQAFYREYQAELDVADLNSCTLQTCILNHCIEGRFNSDYFFLSDFNEYLET